MKIGSIVSLTSSPNVYMTVGAISKNYLMVKCQWLSSTNTYQEAWFYTTQLKLN